jgi:hypothetical protein
MSRFAVGFFALVLSLAGITVAAYAGPFGGPNPAVEYGLTSQSNGGGG